MNYARHLRTYSENQIHTADPGTRLLMLYQGAIYFVGRAKSSLHEGDIGEKGRYILRAHNIISEFLASLDFEIGGEIARNLESLYRYMLDQLTVANLNNDPNPLETVVSLLTTLKDGWEGALAVVRKPASPEGV